MEVIFHIQGPHYLWPRIFFYCFSYSAVYNCLIYVIFYTIAYDALFFRHPVLLVQHQNPISFSRPFKSGLNRKPTKKCFPKILGQNKCNENIYFMKNSGQNNVGSVWRKRLGTKIFESLGFFWQIIGSVRFFLKIWV